MAKQPTKKPISPAPAPAPAPVPVPQPPAQPAAPQPVQTTNGLAIAGFVLAFLIPLLGLIFSIIGLVQASHRNQKGKGLAIAGIIISVIAGFITLILLLDIVFALSHIDWNSKDFQTIPSAPLNVEPTLPTR